MPAHAPAQAPAHVDLADVLRVSILGNSGIGIKILPEALRDEHSEARTMHVLMRLAAACSEVRGFPSVFFDVSEVHKLPAQFSNGVVELIDRGLSGSGEVFFSGINEGAQIEAQLQQWELLQLVFIDRDSTTFIPASAEDREKFGRMLQALQALHIADELGASGDSQLPRRPS